MDTLIRIFNNDRTHIEIDCINQKDNGTTSDASIYTYTVMLVENVTGEIVDGAMVSISSFSEAPVLDIVSYFKELEGK